MNKHVTGYYDWHFVRIIMSSVCEHRALESYRSAWRMCSYDLEFLLCKNVYLAIVGWI